MQNIVRKISKKYFITLEETKPVSTGLTTSVGHQDIQRRPTKFKIVYNMMKNVYNNFLTINKYIGY